MLCTIARLYSIYHPFGFYGGLGILLAMISGAFFVPVFIEYLKTGLVLRFPTLFVCGFVMLSAIQAVFTGLMLQSIRQKDKQQFELERIKAYTRKCGMERKMKLPRTIKTNKIFWAVVCVQVLFLGMLLLKV